VNNNKLQKRHCILCSASFVKYIYNLYIYFIVRGNINGKNLIYIGSKRMYGRQKMGNYNTQYQSYYNNLAKKQRGTNSFSSESNKQNTISNFYIKRITRELIGVLLLFVVVLILKVVVTPKTQYAYNYSKEVINKKYNYSELYGKVKDVKFKEVGVITSNFFEKVKNSISNINGINNSDIDFK